MKIESHGEVKSVQQLKDLVEKHQKQGYIKHVICQPVSHYWACSFPVIIIDGMPDLKGSALILYTGTPESFASWERQIKEALERVAKKRKDEMGRFVQ